ncbi:filamentous hemagglutinin N-terminal domain-containing protein [Oscillatoria sp. HE19RPO]|uniref:two-partner secretion domain-containing protein n=1 Tax=Oscillatoria sp. HE19RPO TaxID=2954806 RepID=UPI0020C334E3|nr:filamentous hemagglutinin N-terminal domain-containing protein [Oscillatoria sp. HE19RPO]
MNEHPHISEKLTLKPGLKLQRFSQTFVLFSSSLLFSCLNGIPATQAQIIPDATLPVNSTVTPQGNINQITGGTQAGGNLFHSFQEFSIPTGSEAFFNNSLDIQNIFSRVTGNSISNIDGLIRANGFANLFLLNPNGIVFGPNAQLSIGGSFLASTANRINFADGTAFSTLPSETPPLLTVSIPIGLQMGVNPGKIVVQGPGNNLSQDSESGLLFRENRAIGLGVQEQTLALVSADIEVNGGNLTSKGGRIELGSVGDNSTVSLNPTNNGWDLGYSEVTDFRNIHLNASASLDASGEGSGRIHIQSRNLSLTEGSAIRSFVEGNQPGQDLTLRTTETIELSGSNPWGVSSNVETGVNVTGSNNAGNLTVETAQLIISDGSFILSSTEGEGSAGDITIRASESVTLSRSNASGLISFIKSTVFSGATGDAGNLTVETAQLSLTNGSLIDASTSGQGNAGDISVRASEFVNLSGINSLGSGSSLTTPVMAGGKGNSGSITVETAELNLSDGAFISAFNLGEGNGGDLTVRASESVTLMGLDSFGNGSSFLNAVAPEAIGNSGNIIVETPQLNLFDGASISTSTAGFGNAGMLTIRASEFMILRGLNAFGTGSNVQSQVFPGAIGDGGNLRVETPQLSLSDGATISSSTSGQGDAGNLTVETSQVSLFDGAIISSSAFGQGNGGNLTVRATESVILSGYNSGGRGSSLLTGVGSQAIGDGGPLTVETAQLILSDGASIQSSTLGQGNAGNLTIDTIQLRLFDGTNIISSSFGQGNSGDLTIQADESIVLSGFNNFGNGSILETIVGMDANGNAGQLTITTPELTLSDEAIISNSIFGQGNGGDLIIDSSRLSILNGSDISTATLGQGNSGNLSIQSSEFILLSGTSSSGLGSSLETQINPGATGDAGHLTLNTSQLYLMDGARISSSTFGQGNAGDLKIQASEFIILRGSNDQGGYSTLRTLVGSEAVGNAGNININTRQLSILDGGSIIASTEGQGNAGSLTLIVPDAIVLRGVDNSGFGSSVLTNVGLEALGDAGNLNIETNQLVLSDGAFISASTSGQGNAGNLNILAFDSVILEGLDSNKFSSFLGTQVESGATGDAGNITVETVKLTLSDGATISSSTWGQGNAGSLSLRATEFVTLSGLDGNGWGSALVTEVGSEARGIAGNLTVETTTLTLSDGAAVSSTTFGEGNAGELNIRASDSVNMRGLNNFGFGSFLGTQVDLNATGNAGNITIETSNLYLNDGATISSSTFSQGNAGNLTVLATESVTLGGFNSDGRSSLLRTLVGEEVTEFLGSIPFKAGNLTVETSQISLLDGARISSETLGYGNAGDVAVHSDEVTLRDGARISVSAIGDFSPGVLRVNTDRLFLDNQSLITAETQSGSQGNIDISANSLIMRRNSNITTNATGPATGGNINITTEVLAALENSNINANSEQAQGGTVTIDAQAIFGTEFRESPTSNSDITATGADSSLSGTVSINTPEIDPTSGLVELPTTLTDVAQQIDSSCRPGQQQSEFIVTGRGGLPPNPIEAISDEATWLDLRPGIAGVLSGANGQTSSVADASNPVVSSPTPPLVEAQGWVVNAQGKMELVAQGSEVTLQNRTVTPTACLAN